MQCTNMGHFTVVAWYDCQEVMAARRPFFVLLDAEKIGKAVLLYSILEKQVLSCYYCVRHAQGTPPGF